MGGIPLQPLQVLWVNFGLCVPLAIALGLDIPTPGLMNRPPRKSNEQIMDLRKAIQYTIIGLVVAVSSILAGAWALEGWDNLNSSSNVVPATTMVLTTFSLATVLSAIATRFDPDTIFRQEMLAGRKFWQMTALAAGLTLVVTGVQFLQRIFNTQPLSARQWGIAIVCALVTPLVIEIIKLFERRSAKA
jgi:Ca2+-transporting ATPase